MSLRYLAVERLSTARCLQVNNIILQVNICNALIVKKIEMVSAGTMNCSMARI